MYFCGVKLFSGMIEFTQIQKDWFKERIELRGVILIVHTLIDLFTLMDSKSCGSCILEYIKNIRINATI